MLKGVSGNSYDFGYLKKKRRVGEKNEIIVNDGTSHNGVAL